MKYSIVTALWLCVVIREHCPQIECTVCSHGLELRDKAGLNTSHWWQCLHGNGSRQWQEGVKLTGISCHLLPSGTFIESSFRHLHKIIKWLILYSFHILNDNSREFFHFLFIVNWRNACVDTRYVNFLRGHSQMTSQHWTTNG